MKLWIIFLFIWDFMGGCPEINFSTFLKNSQEINGHHFNLNTTLLHSQHFLVVHLLCFCYCKSTSSGLCWFLNKNIAWWSDNVLTRFERKNERRIVVTGQYIVYERCWCCCNATWDENVWKEKGMYLKSRKSEISQGIQDWTN